MDIVMHRVLVLEDDQEVKKRSDIISLTNKPIEQQIARHQQQQEQEQEQEQEQKEQTPDPYLAGVLRIIDGDTIKVASIKSNIIQNVRLALLDTPERREPGYEAATIRQIIIQVKTLYSYKSRIYNQ